MPCSAPVRGKTDLINPWEPLTDNDPCGKPDFAAGLCKPHWQAKNGLVPDGLNVDGQTVLLVHADGADGATAFSDASPFAHTVTAQGTAKVATAQSVFGGASALFDATAACRLTTPDAPEFEFGAGDFTIDLWYRPVVHTTGRYLCGKWDTTGNQRCWGVTFNPGNSLQFVYSVLGSDVLSAPWNVPGGISNGTWYHIAVVRSGGTLLFFVNGSLIGSTAFSGTLFDSTAPVTIGAVTSGTEMNGYLDEVRLSKGIARWTAPFNPPAAPYS